MKTPKILHSADGMHHSIQVPLLTWQKSLKNGSKLAPTSVQEPLNGDQTKSDKIFKDLSKIHQNKIKNESFLYNNTLPFIYIFIFLSLYIFIYLI